MSPVRWPAVTDVLAKVEMPEGYSGAVMRRDEVPVVTKKLRDWFPDIATGYETHHLHPEFYYENAVFDGEPDQGNRHLYLLVLKDGSGEIVLVLTFTRDVNALSVSGRLLAIDPAHRGKGLAVFAPRFMAEMARQCGAGLVYYYCSLKTVHQQKAAEHAGYRLVGILPASDLQTIAPGVVKRVPEAIYAKVLVGDEELFVPPELTPATRKLWDFLFY